MEIILTVFLGLWIAVAGILSYIRLKNEYSPYLDDDKREKKERIEK